MQQHQSAVHLPGQAADVVEDGSIGIGCVEGDENGVVHGHGADLKASLRICKQPEDIEAGDQDTRRPPGRQKKRAVLHFPMRIFELVNCSSGIMASGKLDAEDHLAEGEQIVHTLIALDADDQHGWDDREQRA